QRGVEDTECSVQWRGLGEGWRTLNGGQVEGLEERGGGHRVEASGGIGREGWRTLSGAMEDWQRGLEDTEWRPVEDWQRGVEDTEWQPVEGVAERVRTLSRGQWRDWQRGVEDTEWRPVKGLAERGSSH
ncbi:unnamed protein product, partial [Staurois parvus]